MKKILLSMGLIVVAAAAVAGTTGAFFSDTESSTSNTFVAGAIDLKISATSTYSNVDGYVPASTWELKDLDVVSDKFFNFSDIKPGDTGTTTIALNVINNDAYVCASVSGLTNFENDQTEPEAKVDTTTGTNDGELQSEMLWTVWNDVNENGVRDNEVDVEGDGILETVGENVLAQGHPRDGVLALHDSTYGGVLAAGATDHLVVSWTLPATSDNRTQTDSMTGTISFEVVQSRNNSAFQCVARPEPEAM